MTAGRRVVVIGLARSGTALVRALAADGDSVLVVDSADSHAVRERARALPPGVDVQLGGYDAGVVRGAAMVSPSPGVPWDSPELEEARRLGIPIRSEIALVFERCRGRVIGITGTNGKTTTTALVASILERGPAAVHLGGNIGTPMLDRLDSVRQGDWVVLELSSFQLETVAQPHCSIGCVLNLTPDHLDRHHGVAEYAALKERIVRFAHDAAVLGHDDPITRDMAQRTSAPVRWFGSLPDAGDGATTRDGDIVSVEQGRVEPVMPVADVPLFGRHNILNVLAAVAVTRAAGMQPSLIADGVRAFRAVPHRLQVVLEQDGVLWVNDSKATNTDSAVMALRAFGARPLVWIGGGRAMDAPLQPLVDEVARRAEHVVLAGETAAALDAALAHRGFANRTVVPTLAAAVDAAAQRAHPGSVVLFAPGFKSFDQFRDFEERGEVFMQLVRQRAAAGERA